MQSSETFLQRWDREYALASQLCRDEPLSGPQDISLASDQTFQLGSTPRSGFFLIRSGHLALSLFDADEEHVIRICKEGSLVGFGSWYLPSATVYRFRMLTDGVVTFYPRQDFQALRTKSPKLMDLVDEALLNNAILKDQRIIALEQTSSKARIAALLDSLSKKFGRKTSEGILIDINLDRLTMAQLSGTTQVNLSRILKHFAELGWVVRKGRRLVLTRDRLLRSAAKTNRT